MQKNAVRDWSIIGLVIIVAMGIQVWAALQWPANYHPDEAALELIALHATRGELATYFPYGQHYMGTIEAMISAVIMKAFGVSVFAVRSSSLLLFLSFLILHVVLISRFWNRRVALLSILALAFPSWKILLCTCRPFGNYPTLLTINAALLILTFASTSPKKAIPLRLLLWGILVGLGSWTNPIFLIYLFTIGCIYALSTPEWDELYQRLSRWITRMLRTPPDMLFLWITLAITILVLTALVLKVEFWTSPQLKFLINGIIFLPIIIGSCLVMLLFLFSQRRSYLVRSGVLITVGFIAGNSPMLGAWVFHGIRPGTGTNLIPISALFERIAHLAGNLFPTMVGLPTIKSSYFFADTKPELWQRSPILFVLWIILYLVALAAIGRFLFAERKTIRSLFSLSPLTPGQRPVLIFGLLFFLPLIMMTFTGTMKQNLAIRYLVPALPACTVFLALLFDRIISRRKFLGYALVGLWIVVVGGDNLSAAAGDWHNPSNRWYAPETVAAIEDYLREKNAKGCYTDNWAANVLNFITQERIPFTVYIGIDPYPHYSHIVASSPVQGLLLNPKIHLPDPCTIPQIIEKIIQDSHQSRTSADFSKMLENKKILERKFINGWNILIINR